MTTLLWDVGNVLVLASHRLTHVVLEEYGVSPERAKLFFQNPEYKSVARGDIAAAEFYKALVKKYLQTSLSYEQVVLAHDHHIFDVDWQTAGLLDACAQRHDIAFVTNTMPWQTQRVENELINLEMYGKVFRSDEMRLLKSEPAYFEKMLDDLGIEGEDAVLIDDSGTNVDVAASLGIKGIVYDPRPGYRSEKLKEDLKNLKIL